MYSTLACCVEESATFGTEHSSLHEFAVRAGKVTEATDSRASFGLFFR
jgi:hypothetical protein